MKVKFNTNLESRARRASNKAAKAVFSELNRRFQDAISTKAWQWPRETIRSNGQRVPAGLRTIVDSEALKGSNKGPSINGTNVEYRWSARYARATHNGALIYPWGNKKKKKVLLPARPWTSAVLGTVKVSGIDVYPIADRYKNIWLTNFKKA